MTNNSKDNKLHVHAHRDKQHKHHQTKGGTKIDSPTGKIATVTCKPTVYAISRKD